MTHMNHHLPRFGLSVSRQPLVIMGWGKFYYARKGKMPNIEKQLKTKFIYFPFLSIFFSPYIEISPLSSVSLLMPY